MRLEEESVQHSVPSWIGGSDSITLTYLPLVVLGLTSRFERSSFVGLVFIPPLGVLILLFQVDVLVRLEGESLVQVWRLG